MDSSKDLQLLNVAHALCWCKFVLQLCHPRVMQHTVGEPCRYALTWRPSRALRSRWWRCTFVRHVAQALCKEEAKQARLAFCTLAHFSLLRTTNSFQLAKALHTHMGHQYVYQEHTHCRGVMIVQVDCCECCSKLLKTQLMPSKQACEAVIIHQAAQKYVFRSGQCASSCTGDQASVQLPALAKPQSTTHLPVLSCVNLATALSRRHSS